eukprot:1940146-Rhodomonas_salina.1
MDALHLNSNRRNHTFSTHKKPHFQHKVHQACMCTPPTHALLQSLLLSRPTDPQTVARCQPRTGTPATPSLVQTAKGSGTHRVAGVVEGVGERVDPVRRRLHQLHVPAPRARASEQARTEGKDGREGRKEGRKGRKGGRKEGTERRKEGRKGGRKGGREREEKEKEKERGGVSGCCTRDKTRPHTLCSRSHNARHQVHPDPRDINPKPSNRGCNGPLLVGPRALGLETLAGHAMSVPDLS